MQVWLQACVLTAELTSPACDVALALCRGQGQVWGSRVHVWVLPQ